MRCVKMGKNLARLETVLTCPIRQFICRITNICRRTVRLRAVKLVYNMMVVVWSISCVEGRRQLFRLVIKSDFDLVVIYGFYVSVQNISQTLFFFIKIVSVLSFKKEIYVVLLVIIIFFNV